MDGLRSVLASAPIDRGDLTRKLLDQAGQKFRTTAQRGTDMLQTTYNSLLPQITDPKLKKNLRDALQQFSLMDNRSLTRSARSQAMGAISELFAPYGKNVPWSGMVGEE
jgi:hypothetical protein